ncbi:MAG: hypothetical protein CM15mP83_2440 [Flavobacteriaceae bacterium]|nr:MAG: hypothetical protein CM15mP83_2440 [Flavobacteriaceae bacterium]
MGANTAQVELFHGKGRYYNSKWNCFYSNGGLTTASGNFYIYGRQHGSKWTFSTAMGRNKSNWGSSTSRGNNTLASGYSSTSRGKQKTF